MTYPTIENYNTSEGLQVLFQYSTDIVPFFMDLILLGFFIIVALGSFFAQKSRLGYGNFPASFAVAGWLTTIIVVIMTTISNLVSIGTLVTTISLSIIGTIWFYFSSN